MEVHAHTHTARKKWTHYFWEFLMLFLAVFCGFLAEYQLEHVIENQREKAYIKSMIEDAVKDTANIHYAIPANINRIKYADSLAHLYINYRGTQQENSLIYRAYRKCIHRPDLVYPTERTMFQLKNSGGMRLIRKKKAVNSIVAYDEISKMLINQQAYYEMYLTEVTNASMKHMNFLELWGEHKNPLNQFDSARLISTDKTNLMVLGNTVLVFQGILKMYNQRLYEMEAQAADLITTLKKEYKLSKWTPLEK